MKRMDKAYWSSWVLLSVFIPMVLLSSLHVHPDLAVNSVLCHECLEHTVHNGHILAVKASVDCPLCAFQFSVYQGQSEIHTHYDQHVCHVEINWATPSIVVGFNGIYTSRAPPFTFCA